MSEYSPMGTRMPSRRASFISRKSFGGKSSRSRRNSVVGTNGSPSTRASYDGEAAEGATERPRYAARATTLAAEIEADGDDDITNGKLELNPPVPEHLLTTSQSVYHAFNQGKINQYANPHIPDDTRQSTNRKPQLPSPLLVQRICQYTNSPPTTNLSPKKIWHWP